MTPDQVIAQGHYAQRLLDDEVLNRAFDWAERAVFDAWKVAETPALREELGRRVVGIEFVKHQLRAMVDAQVHAEQERSE